MDLLEFLWPAWAYEPAGAPLHAVFAVKQEYIQKYNDPVVQWTPATASGHDSWMGLFLYIEFAFLLPTALYGVYRLGVQRRGTSGRDELLFLVYGLEVSFTTLVCIYDTLYWDSAACSAELKRELQVQLYGPWLVIRKCPPRGSQDRPRLTINQRPSAPSTWLPGSWAVSRLQMRPREPKSRSRAVKRGLQSSGGPSCGTLVPIVNDGNVSVMVFAAEAMYKHHLTVGTDSRRRGIFSCWYCTNFVSQNKG